MGVSDKERFRSTPPREGRLGVDGLALPGGIVSIHAPTRGATLEGWLTRHL